MRMHRILSDQFVQAVYLCDGRHLLEGGVEQPEPHEPRTPTPNLTQRTLRRVSAGESHPVDVDGAVDHSSGRT
ncbi:hypothetical protein ACU5JM_00580 (plasmid) [Rhodococcus erythropolis]|uniref:hypothetical protein n=1 Tax=Rhodococcus erythropolis TaxID=1833 RepID=UPI00406BB0B7